MKITYHGHSFLEIDTDTKILIDPYITGNPLCDANALDFSPEFIFLTHGHKDHYGDAEFISKISECRIYAMAELSKWIEARGFDVGVFNLGGTINLGKTNIHAVVAMHSNSTPDGKYGGLACGFVIEYGGNTVYLAGDTSIFSDMSLIGEKFDIDIAFLPIGGTFTMDIHDAAKAAGMLGPSVTVPIHFNTFSAVNTNPVDFCDLLENEGIEGMIIKPGDYIELNKAM